MVGVIRRSKEKFQDKGFVLNQNIIEVFPTIILSFCGGLEKLVEKIQKECKIKIEIPKCISVSHQKMAFVCALISFLHSKSLTNFLGHKDGFLYLPRPVLWQKKWQEKFFRAWQEKDYLKYRYLKTDVFK